MALPKVGVTLTLEGTGPFLSQLGRIDAGIKNLGKTAKDTGTAFDGVAGRWGAAAGKMAEAANKAAQGTSKVEPAADKAAGGIDKLKDKAEGAVGSLGRLGGAMGTAAKAASGLALVTGGAILAGLGGAAVAGLSFNNSMEQASARINAFTKDGAVTKQILADLTVEAAKTPFAFGEMANAAAALGPAAKSSGTPLMELIKQAEILAASNPAEGLEGASFALKEALSGDFTSAIERFNLSRSYINQLKAEGVPALEALSMAMSQAGYDADLVANMAETMEGRWSTFQDTFTTLAGQVTQPIFDALSSGLGGVNEKLAVAGPWMTEMAGVLAGQVAGAVAYVSSELTSFSENIFNADGTLKSFTDIAGIGLQVLVDQIARLLGIDLGGFALGWEGLGGEVLAILGNLGSRLASWASEAIPPMLAALASAGQRLLGWAQEQAPGWAAGLAALGQQLGTWVIQNLPTMLGALGDARNALVSWVLDSLPGWASALAEMGYQLYNWVLANLPALGGALGTVAGVLLAKTGEFIAIVVPKLAELGSKLVVWIATEVLPKLPGELMKIGTALVGALAGFAIAIAPEVKKLQDKFVLWINEEVLPKLPGELAKIGMALVTGIGGFIASVGTEAGKVGQAVIDGIKNAITSGVNSIANAARDAAQQALEAAKNALGISSPSKAFYEQVGEPIGQGMALGILAELGTVRDAAVKVGDEALNALSGIAEKAQKIMSEALGGRVGLARGGLGALGQARDDIKAVQDAQQDLNDLRLKAAEAERDAREAAAEAEKDGAEKAAEIRADAREKDDEQARKQGDLEQQLGRARYTAANNIDPEKREQAAEKVREIEADIAEIVAKRASASAEAAAKATEAEAQARKKAAEAIAAGQAKSAEAQRGQAEAQRELEAATQTRDNRARLVAEAQAQAREIAKTDTVAAQQYLEARLGQIDELLDIQAEYHNATTAAERNNLAWQLYALKDAQALELEQLRQGLQQRAAELANVTQGAKPTGSALIDGVIAGVAASQGRLAAQLTASLQAALAAAQASMGIHSPSLVFNQQVGQPIIGGIIEGVKAQMPALSMTMQGVGAATVRPALQGARTSSSTINSGHAFTIDARGAQRGVGGEIRAAVAQALSGRTGQAVNIRRMR